MTILSVLAPSVIQQVLDNIFDTGIGDGTVLIQGVLLIAMLARTTQLLSYSDK